MYRRGILHGSEEMFALTSGGGLFGGGGENGGERVPTSICSLPCRPVSPYRHTGRIFFKSENLQNFTVFLASTSHSSKILALFDCDENSAGALLNDYPCQKFLPQRFWKLSRLPITLPGNCSLGINRAGCRDGFEGIVSTAVGVLGDVRSRHRLTGGTRSKTGRTILSRPAGGGMGGKGSAAYLSHLKYTRADPGSACFDGSAWAVVLRIRALK